MRQSSVLQVLLLLLSIVLAACSTAPVTTLMVTPSLVRTIMLATNLPAPTKPTTTLVIIAKSTTTPRPTATSSISPTPSTTPEVITGTEVFTGHYFQAFETSTFVPCNTTGLPKYGVGYWIEAEPQSGFYELYNTTIASLIATQVPRRGEGVMVFARFEGILSPEKAYPYAYGHLSQYTRQITVTKALDMELYASGQCSK